MNKIPVGRTIAQAYGFAFGRYFTTLGIIWLPALAMMALTYYFRADLSAAMMAGAHGESSFPFNGQLARLNLLFQFVGLVIGAIISVGVTKAVLGLPRGPRFFYAGFGAAELRVIVGYFALALLFFVFVVGFAIGVGILAGVTAAVVGRMGSEEARVIAALGVILAVFVVWFVLLYIFARLTFLFLPSTVAEKRIGIARSWELTRGNFWRIFVIGLSIFIPMTIVICAAAVAWLGREYFDFMMQHANEPEAVRAYMMQRVSSMYSNYPVVAGIMLVAYPVFYGLVLSPASFAYRALVPAEIPSAPMPVPEPAEPEEKKDEKSDLPPEIEEILEQPSEHGEDEHKH